MPILQQFNYQGTPVRTVTDDGGEPWFVAADVAKVLGYSKAAAMTRTLDADEKGLRTVHTLGGSQQLSVVNEPGLYSAILRSRIPEAKAFKRWVTHEVLPQIRKTGTYGQPPAPDLTGLAPESLTYLSRVGRALEAAITLDEDEKGVTTSDTLGGVQQMTYKQPPADLTGLSSRFPRLVMI